MQCPNTFNLPPPLDPDRFPPPSPPKFLKHQVYENTDVFSKVDQHAIQVSQRAHPTFRELMWDLVFRVRLQELEIARVIFRWMTSKNMYEIEFRNELPGTPEDALTSFRKRKGTLARILEVMCCYAQIPCVSISGFAKGVEYLPGQKFQGRPANHSWNAIFIQGAWQLIDAHWATRYLSSDKNIPENLVYEYDDFYFIMEPQQAVYSHFPNVTEWQLLDRSLTLQQFEDLPLTKSQFFKCGMDFRQQHHGVVHTREGKLKMCLGFWKPGIFTYSLQYGEAMEESYAGIPLKNYALQETLDSKLNFFFRLPMPGVFYLTVYASDASHTQSVKGPTISGGRHVVAESVFRAACEYKIVCDQAAQDASPYPACHDVNWGPSWPLVIHYGLEPSVRDGVIPTHTGSVEVRFGRQRPDVNLLAKLRRNGLEDEVLDNFLQEYVAQDTQDVVFTANLPEGGEYGLEIYANDPTYEGDTYTHICQYMLYFQPPAGFRSKLQSHMPPATAKMYQANPRQMWNYEDHAPSIGTLPRPYLEAEADIMVQQMTEGVSRMPPGRATVTPVIPSAYQYNPGGPEPNGRANSSRQAGAWPGQEDLPPPPSDFYADGSGGGGGGGYGGQRAHAGGMRYGNESPRGSSRQEQYTRMPSTEPLGAYRPEDSTANWDQQTIERMPKSFVPVPLEASMAPKPMPETLPPSASIQHDDDDASELSKIENFHKFELVDTHAVQVSRTTQSNFNQLIWELIYARNITDDLEKMRAIFLWLCTKDLSKMNFSGVQENSPESILMGITTGRSTYAQVFQTLCQYAKLHCNIIPGYAKGAEYAPGMRFSGRQGQHSWNAVYVNGVWSLVDCHWAARRLIGKQSSIENIRYELDMFYFLPNPAHLIYTHFPLDKVWQLLREPISLQEFESLAPVKSSFFKFGLRLRTHRFAVIGCGEELSLKIGHPSGAGDQLSFTFTLAFADAVGSTTRETEEWQGLKLSTFGMQEMAADNSSTFTLRPPRPGAYKLLIYAKRSDAQQKDAVFGAVCEYRLEADFQPSAALQPFPPCQNQSYGACEAAKRYGISSSSQSAVIQVNNSGCAQVRFCPEQRGLRMMAKLRSHRHSEEQLNKSLLLRHIADNEIIVNVFPPDVGEYGLELYACDPKSDGGSYYMVWQHLVVARSPSPVRGLPTIPASFLGPLPKFRQFGLETVSHVDPFVQTNTGDLCVQVRSPSGPMRMMAQLIEATYDANNDCSQHVLQQSRKEVVYYLIRFPKPGYYKFVLFALPFTDPADSIPAVFNYLVEASQPSKMQSPFPQQFQQWKEGCYLHSPQDGRIPATNPYVTFEMEVPNATAVAVVIGDDWTQLERHGERWRGEVYVEKHVVGGGALQDHVKRVSVCANYGSFQSSYSTILEYTL